MLIKDMVNANAEVKSKAKLSGDVLVQTFDEKDVEQKHPLQESHAHNTFQSEALNENIKYFGINNHKSNNTLKASCLSTLLLFHEKINDGDFHIPMYAVPYGMANTNTGNTAKDMGSLNPNEVESGFGYYRSVYDFSTSQCNGDLKSVGYYSQKMMYEKINIPNHSIYPVNTVGVTKNSAFYIRNDGELEQRKIAYRNPVFLSGVKDGFDTEFSDTPSNFTLCTDGKCRAYYITSSKKLREMVFDPSTQSYEQTDYDVAGLEYSNDTAKSTTDPDNNYIYCICAGGGTDNRVAYKIQKSNMTIVNSVNEYMDWSWGFAKYYNGAILFLNHNLNRDFSCAYWLDAETFYLHGTSFKIIDNFTSETYYPSAVQNMICDKYGLCAMYYVGYPQYSYHIDQLFPLMFTTYNLPETVNKTASQTMKITYTLTEES